MENGWAIWDKHQEHVIIEYNLEKQRCFLKSPDEEPTLGNIIYMLVAVERFYEELPVDDYWDVMWDITDLKLFTKEALWVFGHFVALMVYKYPFIRRYRICTEEASPHALHLINAAAEGEGYTHSLEPQLFKSRGECEAYIDSFRGGA